MQHIITSFFYLYFRFTDFVCVPQTRLRYFKNGLAFSLEDRRIQFREGAGFKVRFKGFHDVGLWPSLNSIEFLEHLICLINLVVEV
jgi:hypothetical protein